MGPKTSWLVLLVCLGLTSCATSGVTAGLRDGALRPCPGSPNCVRSELPERDVDPLPCPADGGWGRLRQAVIEQGGNIESEGDGYLHATFRSGVFGFVDDLECRRDGEVAQVRSASRTGWWDLGVNRRRVERLRAALAR